MYKTLYRMRDVLYALSHQALLNKKGNGQECVVVGNGPSLKKTLEQKLYFFKGKEVMCVNRFAYSKYFTQVKPAYYLFADPVFWSKKMSIKIKNICSTTIDIMKKKVVWPMVIYLPLDAKGLCPFEKLAKLNQNINIRYYISSYIEGPRLLKYFLYAHNFGTPLVQTVLVAGIFLSLNMGFKKIYIVGADHSWHQNLKIEKDNTLFIKDIHFSDIKEQKDVPFYKNERGLKKYTFTMSEIFAVLSGMFIGHLELEKYSKYLHSKIYNASEVSFIDAYQRFQIPDNDHRRKNDIN